MARPGSGHGEGPAGDPALESRLRAAGERYRASQPGAPGLVARAIAGDTRRRFGGGLAWGTALAVPALLVAAVLGSPAGPGVAGLPGRLFPAATSTATAGVVPTGTAQSPLTPASTAGTHSTGSTPASAGGVPGATVSPTAISPGPSAANSAPRCVSADIGVAATTDQSNYAPGQVVVITMTVTNTGGSPCRLVDRDGCRIDAIVASDPGVTVWQASRFGCHATVDRVLAARETYSETFHWDQQICNTGGQPPCPTSAPSGGYAAGGFFDTMDGGPAPTVGSKPAPFTIGGGNPRVLP